MSCFDSALAESHASVTAEMEREYVELLEELKRESPRGRGTTTSSWCSDMP